VQRSSHKFSITTLLRSGAAAVGEEAPLLTREKSDRTDWVEKIVDGTPKPRQFFKFRGALSGPTSSTKLREETVRPVQCVWPF